jgi:hypothetical protein
MSKKEKDNEILFAPKKTSTQKLKELSKIEGKHINVSQGIDTEILTLAIKKKAQIEELERELKDLEKSYQGLRGEILTQIEGIEESKYDTVEYVNDGQRAFKYPRNSKSGQLDEQKLETLARKKKAYSKVFKKVTTTVVDEDALLTLLQNGTFTTDEYKSVTVQKISPVLEIKAVNESE